jgi:hypothetical protein
VSPMPSWMDRNHLDDLAAERDQAYAEGGAGSITDEVDPSEYLPEPGEPTTIRPTTGEFDHWTIARGGR